MTGLRNMEIKKIDMPVPKPGEVLIKVEYAGICGSDIHYYEIGRIANNIVKGDFILGHECAGEVVEVGSDVKYLKPGDRVALEPGISCGCCEFCKKGKYNLCPSMVFLGTPPIHGAFRKYICFPEKMCFKLPDNVTAMEGALIEPLAVGMHAASQGSVKLGSRVAILGAGCIGLVTLLACMASGATEIFVVDVLEKRLEYAKKLGATCVINAKDVDSTEKIREMTQNEGVDVVIETAGTVKTIEQTPYIVKRGGTIVLLGLASQDTAQINYMKLIRQEVELKTVFRYRNIYPSAIQAVANGKINVKGIVTHEFDFDDTKKALDFVVENKQEVVKAVIKF